MNDIKVARKRIPGMVRAIDEIAFQASILKLNAAVEAASGERSETPWSAQAASETLALIAESITHSPALAGVRRTTGGRHGASGKDYIARMTEQLQRIQCAAPAARMKRPLGESR